LFALARAVVEDSKWDGGGWACPTAALHVLVKKSRPRTTSLVGVTVLLLRVLLLAGENPRLRGDGGEARGGMGDERGDDWGGLRLALGLCLL
jgi:hypothetical protein